MGKPKPFRLWFYLRTGYSTYFTFIFASVNVMTVTYYLAIENLPFLKEIFPEFSSYVISMAILGIPTLVFVGWLHYRRSRAFASEADISVTSNPYQYKLPPGFWLHVIMPFFLSTSKTLVKLSKQESLSDEDLNKINEIEKKMEHLLKGGYVGDYRYKDFKEDISNE
jgi:hypothetical protein